VADRPRHLTRDHLTSRKPRSARTSGTEDVAEHAAYRAQYGAEAGRLRRLLCPTRALRCNNRPARGTRVETLLQELVGGFGVNRLIILALHRALGHERLALVRSNRAEPRGRRTDHAALHHRRRAVAFEEGDQGLPLPQLHDDLGGVELGIGTERLRRR